MLVFLNNVVGCVVNDLVYYKNALSTIIYTCQTSDMCNCACADHGVSSFLPVEDESCWKHRGHLPPAHQFPFNTTNPPILAEVLLSRSAQVDFCHYFDPLTGGSEHESELSPGCWKMSTRRITCCCFERFKKQMKVK